MSKYTRYQREDVTKLSLTETEISLIISGLDCLWLDRGQQKTRLNIAKKLENDQRITNPDRQEWEGQTLTEYWRTEKDPRHD
jgi:hypothetical protein